MPWIAFAILLYVVTALQTTLAPLLAVHTIRPDLLVIVAVHYCLAARATDALFACWFVGLAMDLTSLGYQNHSTVGLHALLLGVIGWVVVKLRDLTFRDSIWTQLFFTFSVKFALALLGGVHMLWVLKDRSRLPEVVASSLYAAIYTAILAPYGHWLLKRLRGPLGIGATQRSRVT
jgi:rod shape-determining protein MreD